MTPRRAEGLRRTNPARTCVQTPTAVPVVRFRQALSTRVMNVGWLTDLLSRPPLGCNQHVGEAGNLLRALRILLPFRNCTVIVEQTAPLVARRGEPKCIHDCGSHAHQAISSNRRPQLLAVVGRGLPSAASSGLSLSLTPSLPVLG